MHAQTFHERSFRHLWLPHLQLDELRSSKQVLWVWLAIDPCTKLLPLFTSDGLNLYFDVLTAHFGHWLEAGRRGRHRRQWQVEAGLINGQVTKSYRRRKLVRVTHVMRLGTQADLTVARPRMGLSGRINTAFIERVNLTVRNASGSARKTYLGDGSADPTPAGPPGVVASVLSFCPSSCIVASGTCAAARTR